MNFRTPALGIGCVLILAGCTTANQQSIYRHTAVFEQSGSGSKNDIPQAVFIASDARSRGRTVVKVKVKDKNGNESWQVKECRDIPPDVYTLMGASFQGSLSANVKPDPQVSANMANAIQESGRQIQRSQANALLNSIQEDQCALWQGGSMQTKDYMTLSVLDLRLVAAVSAIENISSMVEPAQISSGLNTTAPKIPTQQEIEDASSEVDRRQKTADDLSKKAKADLSGVTGSDDNDPTCKDIKDKSAESKCEKDASSSKSASDALSTAQSKLDSLKNLSASTADSQKAGATQDPVQDNAAALTRQENNTPITQADTKATTTIKPVSDAVAIKAITVIQQIAERAMNIQPSDIKGFEDAAEQLPTATEDREPKGELGLASIVDGSGSSIDVPIENGVTRRLYIQMSNPEDLRSGNLLITQLTNLFGESLRVGKTIDIHNIGKKTGFIRIYRRKDALVANQLRAMMALILGHDIQIDPQYDWSPSPPPGLIELWLGTEDTPHQVSDKELKKAANAAIIL